MPPTKTDDEGTAPDPVELQQATRQGVYDAVGGEDGYTLEHWTAQHGAPPDPVADPALGPQKFLPEQLPDNDALAAIGYPPHSIPEAQILVDRAEVGIDPKGPEPGELVRVAMSTATEANRDAAMGEATPKREYLSLGGENAVAAIQAAQEAPAEPPAEEGDKGSKEETPKEPRSSHSSS